MSNKSTERFIVGQTYHFIRNHYSAGNKVSSDIFYYGFLDEEMIFSQIISLICISEKPISCTSADVNMSDYQFIDDKGYVYFNKAINPYAKKSNPNDFVVTKNGETEGYLRIDKTLEKIEIATRKDGTLKNNPRRTLRNIYNYATEHQICLDALGATPSVLAVAP